MTKSLGGGACSRLLYNKSSTNSIYDRILHSSLSDIENLALSGCYNGPAAAIRVCKYLKYNKKDIGCRGKQQKIPNHYFCRDFNMEPLTKMDAQLLVHVLVWMNASIGSAACHQRWFHFVKSERNLMGGLVKKVEGSKTN